MVQLGESQGCKMISGLKKEYPKASKSVLQKLSMSKKNSNVNLKNGFKDFNDLNKVYHKYKKKINILRKKIFVLAISGGPDSLALAALSKAYSYEKKIKFYYVLIDHKIRKNSSQEAIQVKKLLKKKIFSKNSC